MRDALVLDRGQDGFRVEPRQYDLARAHPRAREDVRGPGGVEHRADVQEQVARTVLRREQVVLGVGEQVAVAQHHPFGQARVPPV